MSRSQASHTEICVLRRYDPFSPKFGRRQRTQHLSSRRDLVWRPCTPEKCRGAPHVWQRLQRPGAVLFVAAAVAARGGGASTVTHRPSRPAAPAPDRWFVARASPTNWLCCCRSNLPACPLCTESLGTYGGPTTLPCGHNLCLHCTAYLQQRQAQCPLCRVDFPPDLTLVSVWYVWRAPSLCPKNRPLACTMP